MPYIVSGLLQKQFLHSTFVTEHRHCFRARSDKDNSLTKDMQVSVSSSLKIRCGMVSYLEDHEDKKHQMSDLFNADIILRVHRFHRTRPQRLHSRTEIL